MVVDFDMVMGQLTNYFGDTVTVYKHSGYTSDEDDFWHEDEGWEEHGTEHEVLVEEEPSDTTQEMDGFVNEATSAIYAKEEIAYEGDKVDIYGREYVVVSDSTFRTKGKIGRQLLGIRAVNSG